MVNRKKYKTRGPEEIIVQAIMKMLRSEEWFVVRTHASELQIGLPDLLAAHCRYGIRLIEVKNPKSYKFTPGQLECFPKLCSHGAGVWVLIAATKEEYNKLFKSANWWTYLSVMK